MLGFWIPSSWAPGVRLSTLASTIAALNYPRFVTMIAFDNQDWSLRRTATMSLSIIHSCGLGG